MIKQGSTVKLHYTLTCGGEQIDSSSGSEPLSYVHGEGKIVPGLEEQLESMRAGETKVATVEPEKAYGPHDSDAVQKVPKDAFSDAAALKPGDRVSGSAQGQEFEALVVEIGDDEITLDLNHPLAGKTLEFEIEIVEVS